MIIAIIIIYLYSDDKNEALPGFEPGSAGSRVQCDNHYTIEP